MHTKLFYCGVTGMVGDDSARNLPEQNMNEMNSGASWTLRVSRRNHENLVFIH